jgi:hypothetical protein
MALLAVGQLHVQLLEARFGRDAALLQLLEQGIDFGQVAGDLLAACARLLRQLGQAQRLDLQLVGARAGRPARSPARRSSRCAR